MKKITELSGNMGFPWLKKIFRIMKLTTFLILISVVCVFASETYSQSKKLNLNMKNATVKEVLSAIEDQSEFEFMYSGKVIDVNRVVAINEENSKIEDTLRSLFAGTDVNYTIKDRIIVLSSFTVINNEQASSQQQKSVSGKVTDSSGASLPGVSVVLKGTTTGTTTNANGNFLLLNVPENATLQFSFIGMKTQEVKVQGKSSINLSLAEEAVGIDEVVAVGYGTQKKANLTGAVGSIKTDDLKKAQNANMSNAIVGRLSGVIAKQGSGEPGKDGSQISIRGVATYQGNTSPEIIIDGIQRTMQDFSQLDPNEVESVNVLKDAAAAAIFGIRGANGVILVKTKRGVTDKPIASYSFNYGLQSPTKLPEFTSSAEYATLANERLKFMNPASTTPKYTDAEIQKFKDGSDPDRYPNANWYDYIIENKFAIQQQHNFSLKGGTDKVKYFTSLGYLNQSGFYDALNFERYNMRTNIDIEFTKYTTFSADISARMEKTKEAATSSQGVFAETLRNPSTMPAVFSNGYLASPFGGHNNTYAAIKDGGYSNSDNNTILTRFELEQRIPWIDGLAVKGVVALDKNYFERKSWSSAPHLYSINADGTFTAAPRTGPQLNLDQNDNQFVETQAQVTYNKTVGDHSFSGLAMFLQKESTISVSHISAWDYASEGLEQIDAAAQKSATGNTDKYGRQSYIGRVNYAYKQKYLAEANIRKDGTENFAPDYRWGTFSSFSLGWILSEENFFNENVSFVDYLKIRGSYGTLGNDQINSDRFPYYNKYNLYTPMYWLGSNLNYGDYIFGGKYVKGMQPGAIGNPIVTWETSAKTNIGIDAKLLKTVDFSFDFFTETRSNILTQRSASVPLSFGATLPMENIGEVNNKGIEASIGYNKTIHQVKINLNANFTYAKNKIVFMDEAVGTSKFLKREGRPIDAYYGYKAVGIFKTQAEIDGYAKQELQGVGYKTKPGDVKYEDVTGDGKVDSNDRTFLGDGNMPNIIYGISGSVEYRNFDFSFMFQGAGQIQYMLQSQVVWPFFNDGGVPQFWADDHWSASNPNAKYSNMDVNNQNFPQDAPSSLYIYDASYIRLKNLELGYTLPKSLVSKAKLSSVRIYTSGQNLLTFSKVPQVDPETINNAGQSYPNVKSVNFGIKVDF
jgi:TonB-linked SusC/RagA family outer membrane protein